MVYVSSHREYERTPRKPLSIDGVMYISSYTRHVHAYIYIYIGIHIYIYIYIYCTYIKRKVGAARLPRSNVLQRGATVTV